VSPARAAGLPASRLRRALTTAALVVLAVPVVEIVVAVALSRWIGGGATLLLVLLGCLGGVWVLRWAGSGAVRELGRLRRPGSVGPDGLSPVGRDVGEAGLKVVAGLLLLFPGLLTDVVGLLLLVPPVRSSVATTLGGRLRRRFEVAARRVTVRGEAVEGVTVTSWVEDDPDAAAKQLGPGDPQPPTNPR
jgi:UPF0716 protein FxsA